MLKCNLAMLLAERGLKISKVSKDTGISRTTLTALTNNTSQGIQLETIDKLCLYLKIDPSKFFIFSSASLSFVFEKNEKNEFIIINFSEKSLGNLKVMADFQLNSPIYPLKRDYSIIVSVYNPSLLCTSLGITFDLSRRQHTELLEEFEFGFEHFSRFYENLPVIFKTDFENKLLHEICKKHNIDPSKETIDFNISIASF